MSAWLRPDYGCGPSRTSLPVQNISMNTPKIIIITTVALLVAIVGAGFLDAQPPAASGDAAARSAKDNGNSYYTCPMHPTHSARPGKCPYCGGDFILIVPHNVNPGVVVIALLGIAGTAGYMAKKILSNRSRLGVAPRA